MLDGEGGERSINAFQRGRQAAFLLSPGAHGFSPGDARRFRGVAVGPACRTARRVQWVVEYRRELASEDMPRKPIERMSRGVR